MSRKNENNNIIDLFAPGRLCLFGEHSDWAGTAKSMNADIIPGRAIVTGIEQGIYGKAKKCDVFRVSSELSDYNGEVFECEMELIISGMSPEKMAFLAY